MQAQGKFSSGETKKGPIVFLWDGLDEEGCERVQYFRHEKIELFVAEHDQQKRTKHQEVLRMWANPSLLWKS